MIRFLGGFTIGNFSFIQNATSYKKGTYVYFEGQNAQHFYLIKWGKVRLSKQFTSEKIITGVLDSGDIFGVISALSNNSHNETAEVIEDAEIYAISFTDLTDLIVGNPDYGFKIINDFSSQLRELNFKIEKLTSTMNDLPDSQKLLQIAEYYRSNNKPNQALYIFNRFLALYPGDPLVGEIKNKIASIANG